MSYLSRSSQAVHPITSRIEQINRVVTSRPTQISNNETLTIYIFYFLLFILTLFLKNLFMGKYMKLLYPIFSQCGE